MSSAYYGPESFGLTLMGDVDDGWPYEFDMLAVWTRDVDGAMFWGTDSGCSCPTPFEDVRSTADLKPIVDVVGFAREAREWVRSGSRDGTRDDMERLIRKVRTAARRTTAVSA